jgi:hypothetical protein
MDFVKVGSACSLRNFIRIGSAISTIGLGYIGSAYKLSVVRDVRCGSSISLRGRITRISGAVSVLD